MLKKRKYDQYRKDWEESPKNNTVNKMPLNLDIELTNACNLKCEMCPHHSPKNAMKRSIGYMNSKLYKKIIDEAAKKGVPAIKLNYAGESMLHPDLIKFIEYAKKKGILDVQLNTNLTLMKFDMVIDLIYSGLDVIIITDYDIDKQHFNVSLLHLYRNTLNKEKPLIRVKTNEVNKWKFICDEISENKYFDYINLKRNTTISKFKCTQPWQRFLILWNGDVCSCSCGIPVEFKQIGSLKHNTIEELWNSEEMNKLRNLHKNGESHLILQCIYCPARNEYIKKQNIG